MPGVAGPFGGAAAASHLLGLDAGRVRDAFGHAGSQAAGTFAALGSSAVKFHQARGAVSGLLAGLLAAYGFDAARRPFTAEFGGLLRAYADGGHADALTDGLGAEWRLEEISQRRWPAASSLQAVIGAVLTIVEQDDVVPDDVAHLVVRIPGSSYRLNGESGWDDQLSALQSARYVAAVVLHDRRCWLEQYTPERRADPSLSGFARDRVTVLSDDSLPRASAVVTMELAGGERREHRQEVPSGDPADPLGIEDVRVKLREAASGTGLDVEAIAGAVLALETLPKAEHLCRLLRARTG
jgi:2-methylcitrate dehydratase PrpD